MTEIVTLTIEALGHRGDGVAQRPVFVPFALPGETVEAEVSGDRGRLIRVIDVSPPPGSFLQATEAADEALAGLVGKAIGGAKKVLDLFSGCGTLGLALADRASVHAIDGDKVAIGALDILLCVRQHLADVGTFKVEAHGIRP
jgi:tRNA/tmRNA/rRNA uracil-C5-methylase (TrmA/RlmC/RlmD family)